MTFPLQSNPRQPAFQPSPQAGPGGAYGSVQAPPGQPVPGQLPPPQMTMNKPGTVTGIQAILWIFSAIGIVGDALSTISLINFFSPFGLIALAFTLYTTIQALLSPVQISRGKRWAWIWTLVTVIIGLAFSAVAIGFGIWFIEDAWPSLIVGSVLAGLYATLLGLLVSKSARAWILMHRIQRGEVSASAMPGMAQGMAQGAPTAGAPGGAQEPERPATRPATVNVALIAFAALIGMFLWQAWEIFDAAREDTDGFSSGFFEALQPAFYWEDYWYPLTIVLVALIGALTSALLLLKGKFAGRVLTFIWPPLVLAPYAYYLSVWAEEYSFYTEYPSELSDDLMDPTAASLPFSYVRAGLVVLVLIMVFLPGVKRWTPRRPSAPLVMMVQAPAQPMQQYGPPQQGAPAQQPPMQQGPGPQQQPPYPPQY